MRRVMFRWPGAVVLALALGSTLSAARAEELAPGAALPERSPLSLAGRSLAARAPVALSLAAEPRALRWGLETGLPLGFARRDVADGAHAATSTWRLDAFVLASHDRDDVTRGPGLLYTARLAHVRERSSWWLGASSGGARERGDPKPRLQLAAGLMRLVGDLEAEAAWITSSVLFQDDPRWPRLVPLPVGVSDDSLPRRPPVDSTITEPGEHSALWNTAEGSLRWRLGRLALASVGGVSIGDGVRPRRWAQASVEWQLSRQALLVASLGERPAPSLAFRGDAQPRTMLGVRWAPWAERDRAMGGALSPRATEWRSEWLSPGRLLVRLRCHAAASAELAGDFTDWRPVRLERERGGWWSAELDVPPGIHRLQVRVDGGPWQAPPGLPRADDGPGGPSGLLVAADAGD